MILIEPTVDAAFLSRGTALSHKGTEACVAFVWNNPVGTFQATYIPSGYDMYNPNIYIYIYTIDLYTYIHIYIYMCIDR